MAQWLKDPREVLAKQAISQAHILAFASTMARTAEFVCAMLKPWP